MILNFEIGGNNPFYQLLLY